MAELGVPEADAGPDAPDAPFTFVVTDIEVDGNDYPRCSMLAFASVAIDEAGRELSAFEAVLERLPGATGAPQTLAWWATEPEAWAAATTNPRPPADVMADYVAWVDGLPGRKVFAAQSLAFDGDWIDTYLRRFTDRAMVRHPFAGRPVFWGAGLDIPSFTLGLFGWRYQPISSVNFPPAWLGDVPHTHKAIDDARGYAILLGKLLRLARSRAIALPNPEDVL